MEDKPNLLPLLPTRNEHHFNVGTTSLKNNGVMKILRAIYTGYGVIIFTVIFALLFPLFLIPILLPSQFQLIGVLNRWWAKLLFTFIGLPWKVVYKAKLNKKQQYIFCSNHFSYMDIATMGLNRHNTIFVGKNDMINIPVFGFMYKKLHITVDRSKLKSRYSSMLRSLQAIDEGKSLVIFPEGGIITEAAPVMGNFKDGAFRVSIEKKIPIVPVTIPFNWIILPPNEFLLNWKPMKIIFHEPIDPSLYSIDSIEQMKADVKERIEKELQLYLK
jgi:1-acyl-sn-glycerol-3-phosphate acyltransferase